jgi:SAM-dependent methyltransferase
MPAEGTEDDWSAVADRFVAHYASLRGRVRTHVIHEHLRLHLPPSPASVVDIGGGAGDQSLPLARAGYAVTIVDPSEAMLERARARIAATDLAGRVRLAQASGESASAALEGGRFDAVLCHGVLMYLDDPAPMLDALCGLAKPGGVLSIVAKNVDALAMKPAFEGDWPAALAAFESGRQVNGLGIDTRADDIEELSSALEARGVQPIAWYGVRLFTDLWAPDHPTTDSEEVVLRVELAASQRDPYRQVSRLFHLLGRRH